MRVAIGYVVHDVNDAAVQRRVAMMTAGGGDVRLGGFRRGACHDGAIDLGRTHDDRMGQRAATVARTLIDRQSARRIVAGADVLVARNLESLAVAAAVRTRGQRLVYECLDLHRLLLGTGAAARAVQRMEAALLARCDLLVTSSPAFERHWRERGRWAGPIRLVENKVWGIEAPPPARRRDRARPWRIAWLGMLRCRRSLLLLRDLAAAAGGVVEVVVAGRVADTAIPDFAGIIATSKYLRYVGPYAPADLPTLYGAADFAWVIDWYEAGLNSALLLPNRLYESLAFGAVPIALADVETGAWLARHGVGWRVADPTADLPERFTALDGDGYAALAGRVALLPRGLVVADRREGAALVEALAG